ncbi:TetR/AcrR family transcriptional regulator [Amycolatopsis thermophila]|uniref:AcrR family transcriptional regulator n=1 Tax=Amycolatopsis thermophila TaxID=206084 RepID=A0ABU0F1R9_9PSEU|nr:TetR/AcrR family transcriptional regulator [Amycolatopsis thermophila]MDQ0381111.1 AcrR family transcriptional regulator [Amycolatopsis thermophila]
MTRTLSGIYRGATAGERRAERRRRLMDAALEVIGTQGWAAATVRAVCEEAHVGPRFFYESFEDMNALAAAVHDEIVETALTRTLAAVAAAPGDLAAKTHAALATMIADLTDDPRRARVTFSEAHGSEVLMRRRFTAMRAVAEAMVGQIRDLVDLPGERERLLQAVSLVLTGGFAELVLVWLDGGLDCGRDELVAICTEFALTTTESLPRLSQRLARRG